jgi:hypothetical protein
MLGSKEKSPSKVSIVVSAFLNPKLRQTKLKKTMLFCQIWRSINKAELLRLKLIHLFAREVKKLEIEETKTT